jgi:hypothetical protein
VIIVTGKQAGAGRGTGGLHMKIREEYSFFCQVIDLRCIDITPERADITETQIIRNNEQDVWFSGSCLYLLFLGFEC